MLKGIHTAASGMIPRARKQELIAHNLANVGTPGFKREVMFTKELTRAQQKQAHPANDWEIPMVDQTYVDFAPGTFDRTGNPLDLALDGDGFFQLQDEEGNTYLTRSGRFSIDNEGFMSFPGGLRLLGEGGPVQIDQTGEITIGPGGDLDIDGVTVDRILPRTVEDQSQLVKLGGSLLAVPEGQELIEPTRVEVRQGFLEAANVDVVQEMVDMIITYREFEANAKSIQQQDQSLDHLFQRVGGDQ